MATEDATRTGFRIGQAVDPAAPADDPSVSPAIFSEPALVFAIARDPRTLFIYWNIDWAPAFAMDEPKDRLVFLRTVKENGVTESELLIEPLLASYYASVKTPRARYRAELGYYTRLGQWKSVGTSELLTIPPDSPSDAVVVDVATVPFHLSFQKLVDLFSETDGDPLALAVSRIQERALEQDGAELSAQERAVLQAMDISLAELRAKRQAFAGRPNEAVLRKRAEAILGFGATSPSHGFGDSSSATRGYGSAS
jgi:hypothetical protein